MKTLVILQKESNTGSIYDLSSDRFDRDIKFPKGSIYAVVLPAYFGGKGYTTHKTVRATIKAYKSNRQYYPMILDIEGNTVDVEQLEGRA